MQPNFYILILEKTIQLHDLVLNSPNKSHKMANFDVQYVGWCLSVACGVVFVSKCSCEKPSSKFAFNVYGTMSVKADCNTLWPYKQVVSRGRGHKAMCKDCANQTQFSGTDAADAEEIFSNRLLR